MDRVARCTSWLILPSWRRSARTFDSKRRHITATEGGWLFGSMMPKRSTGPRSRNCSNPPTEWWRRAADERPSAEPAIEDAVPFVLSVVVLVLALT